MAVIGTGLLAAAGLPIAVKCVLTLAWALQSGWELHRQRAAFGDVAAIRLFHDGTIRVLSADGRSMPARLATGSVILEAGAWLRLDRTGLGCHGEPLLRSRLGERAWHRFRLVMLQGAFGFGHRGPA